MTGSGQKDNVAGAAPRPVTILQIVPQLDAGGAEKSTVEVAAALVDAGARALVASSGGRLVADVQAAGAVWIPFPALGKNPMRIIANAARLVRLIRREQVDLIHARSRAPAWSALWAARLTGTPFVTTYHGAHSNTNALKRFYSGVMARGDMVIANSYYMADRIQADHPVDPARLVVIHRGVDAQIFNRDAIAPERLFALREAWKLTGDGRRIVLVPARLSPRKGQDCVIAAMAQLVRSGCNDIVCVLAGDPQGRLDYVNKLASQVMAEGLENVVRVVGHCADMPAAYALADVTLATSVEPEAFGRTVPEAQAMGSIIVASDIGGTAETVEAPPQCSENDRTGWKVPPRDATALAQAVRSALELSLERKAQIVAQAREKVRKTYSLRAMTSRTLAVYDRMLDCMLSKSNCEY